MEALGHDAETARPSQTAGQWVGISAVLAVTAGVRLLGITRPLIGNFATKNCVYAMIARNWAEGRASLWYPTLDLLANGGRSLHMLEFPVAAYLTGAFWHVFGGSLDVWGRAVSVAFSTSAVAMMFLFVRPRLGRSAAMAASLTLALSPVSIIYGQAFMLESSLLCFTVAAFLAWDRWWQSGRVVWLVSAVGCLALLLLTKLYMLIVLLPLALEGWRRGAVDWKKRMVSLVALAAACVPAGLWYAHAFRTSGPHSSLAPRIYYSVRQSAESHWPPHPLLATPGYWRQVLDDLAGPVLTPIGLTLALAGLWNRRCRAYGPWLLAAGLLVVLLPRKFNEMNYYYLALLPPLGVLIGLGWQTIQDGLRPRGGAVALLLAATVVLAIRHAIGPAFLTPAEDRPVLAAAQALRERTSQDEPVVTIHGTTIDLLYYCDRPGWALAHESSGLRAALQDCRWAGARYLAIVGADLPWLEPAEHRGEGFRIYRLPQ